MSRPGLLAALAGALCALPAAGCLVSGVVFVDRNGDGIRQGDEPPVAGAVVALERRELTVTDDGGAFLLHGGAPGEIVWVRVPDGYRPGPVWTPLESQGLAMLPLVPLTDEQARAPLTFVVAADTHVATVPDDPWQPGDLAEAFAQATDLATPPRFFTIVGDLTQGNAQPEFDRLADALATTATPWVPVPGNHDWYDGGFTYRSTLGPDNYSFDVGDVHVIVWDTNLGMDEQVAFVAADLAHVDPAMRVIALGHEPPPEAVAAELAALGVDHLFTGHWHANRRVDHGDGLTEWGTQPLLMGSIDVSPSGYRIVDLDGPVPVIEHRERLVRPQLGVVSPHAGTCVPVAGAPLVVAAALDGATPAVTARLDCGEPFPLAAAGGWHHAGELPPLLPGTHTLELEATTPGGRRARQAVALTACVAPATAPVAGDWPQVGGGPGHLGSRAAPLPPPLTARWSASVGGAPAPGGPVVADGVVVVAVVDRAGGDRGGVVALDLATGIERWRHRTPSQVLASPALGDGLVVVGHANGLVEALDLATGAPRWRYELSAGLASRASSLWSSPTIADGTVHVAVQRRLAALDLATGAARWTRTPPAEYPWLGTHAPITVDDGHALVAFNRDLGLSSWDVIDGVPRWANVSNATMALYAAPLVVDGIAYVVNARGELSALDGASGRRLWSVPLHAGGFDWGYSITATPAHADGVLYVATQWDLLLAIDAASGAVRWQTRARPGPLNFAHYRSAQAGFVASPVVTGDLVWVGHPDGTLVAHDTADGSVRWQTGLGAPITSAPAPAGDHLIVATYDGTVRALVPSVAPPPATEASCPPWDEAAEEAGCCGAGRRPGGGDVVLAALVAGGVLVRRRRRAPVRG